MIFRLKPSEIRFSQDSISNTFDAKCNHWHKMIGDTLDDICENRCSIYDIPTIHVVLHNGEWTTADNRRLWVFRELERLGKCTEIPVMESYYIPDAKLTSINGGQSVRVRRNPGGIWHRKPNKASTTGNTLGTGAHFGSSNRSYVYPASRPTVAPASQAYRSKDDFRSFGGRYASNSFSDHFMEMTPSHSDGNTERISSQISDNYQSVPRRSTYTPTYREPVKEDKSCCTIL